MSDTNHATVGCAFASEEAAIAAMRVLSAVGAVSVWRVGATDRERAQRVALASNGSADLDPADPLSGAPGLASGSAASSGVNMGALAGGAIGAGSGLAVGFTSLGSIVPVDAGARPLATALLLFAIGVAVGGVWGSAFGKRSSTHAGFRLIDAMEAGDIALVGVVNEGQAIEAQRLLAENGAADIVLIAGGR